MNDLLRPQIWPSFLESSGVGPCDVPFRYASDQSRGTAGRLPGTRRKRLRCAWHAHLCGLATATHEISGLIIQYRLPASTKRHRTPGSCFVPSETQEPCPVMNLNRETKVHAINFYLKKNDVCTSPSKKACLFHLGSTVPTMRVEQAINWFFQISANGNEQEM